MISAARTVFEATKGVVNEGIAVVLGKLFNSSPVIGSIDQPRGTVGPSYS